MAKLQSPKAQFSLRFRTTPEKWMQPGFKVPEQSPAASHTGEESGGAATAPGGIQGLWQRTPMQQVKEEPGDVLLQQWDTQWQEFLKMVESQPSQWGIRQVAKEPRPWNNAKAFLASFEQVAEACQWPREEWVTRLLPAFSGEAEQAFLRLEARDREDYGKVKAAILQGDILRREKQRQHFRHFCYQESEGPREAYTQLQRLCKGWLQVEKQTKEQILELLILEQFLSILPPEIQSWVQESRPESCSQAVALAEGFLQMQEEGQRQEQQMPVSFEVDAPLSEAEHTWSDPVKDQHCRDTKPGDDGGGLGTLAEERVIPLNEVEKHVPEDFEPAGSRRVSSVKEGVAVLQFHKEKNIVAGQEGCWQELENEEISVCGNVSELLQPGIMVTNGTLEDISEGHGQQQTSKNKSRKQQKKPPTRRGLGKSTSSGAQERMPGEESLGQKRKAFAIAEKVLRLHSGHRKRERRSTAGEVGYRCTDCGKNFIHRRTLHTHQRLHTGEKLYECSDCGKKLLSKSKLVRHQRLHTGERPYKCSYCWKNFSQSCHRNKHERTHVGKKGSS